MLTQRIVHTQHLPHLGVNRDGTDADPDGKNRTTDMAYASTTTHHAKAASGFSVKALLATFREALGRHRVYKQTLAELHGLTGRELADLGISRSMITRVALEAAYGKSVN